MREAAVRRLKKLQSPDRRLTYHSRGEDMAMATGLTDGSGAWAKWRGNALIQLAIMAACLLAWLIAFQGFALPAVRKLGDPGTFVGDGARILSALVYLAGAIFLYRLMVEWIERRPVAELARQPGLTLGMAGFAIGTLLFCAVIALIWLAGGVESAAPGGTTHLIASMVAAAMAAVGEELLFRGVLFRIVERSAGTLTALLVSALLFGLAHLANPDATIVSALAIAIEAGLLLGIAFVASRSLWFPIGIHFAWNATQSSIFGLSSSGPTQHGLVNMDFSGPDWMTGGPLGAESSVISVVLCLAVAALFLRWARQKGEWVPAKLKLHLD